MSTPRNARAEAAEVLPDGHEARVLEPSPPAVGPPDHADDPLDPAGADGLVVSPVTGGDTTWLALAGTDPRIAAFARDRWLGPYPDVAPLPDGLADTCGALRRLALHVVYRMRRNANGKFGLRWTLAGFGTPFYDSGAGDEQVRVDGDTLVHQRGDEVRTEPITSLARAAEFLGLDLDPGYDHGFADVEAAGDVDADLGIGLDGARALGNWFGLAWNVLSELRASRPEARPSLVQLWPEHFDAAIDLAWGSGDDERVNVGFSPGDGFHADPYLYVGPWTADRPGGSDIWNAPFGAVLGHDALAGPGDRARAEALSFVADRIDRLRRS